MAASRRTLGQGAGAAARLCGHRRRRAARQLCRGPRVDRSHLENDMLRIVFNGDGSIAPVSTRSMAREVLAPGAAGNVLAIYRDDGDAWDIPMDYRDRPPERLVLEAVDLVEDGPAGGAVPPLPLWQFGVAPGGGAVCRQPPRRLSSPRSIGAKRAHAAHQLSRRRQRRARRPATSNSARSAGRRTATAPPISPNSRSALTNGSICPTALMASPC